MQQAVQLNISSEIICFAICTPICTAQQSSFTNFNLNGNLGWSNSCLIITCHVEWASSPTGPWSNSWAAITNQHVTNYIYAVDTPMFYRTVCTALTNQQIGDLSAADTLTMLSHRISNECFTILDVRTPAEYTTRHMITATNINYYDASFSSQLTQQAISVIQQPVHLAKERFAIILMGMVYLVVYFCILCGYIFGCDSAALGNTW